jgi:hypothetical protein
VTRPRLGRLVLALAVSLGLLVLTPDPSWACSCAAADTAKQVELAGTVASGTVDWTATDGQTRTYSVDFDSVYKGAAAASEKLVTSAHEASCGLADLAVGKRYLFFVEGRHPGVMRVGLCGGTVAYDASVAARVEALTGPPGTPLPSPDLGAEASGGGSTSLVVALGLGVALLGVAAGIAVRRRG